MAVDHNTKVIKNRIQAEQAALELIEKRKAANTNRLKINMQILTVLADFMRTREDLRFCQVLSVLGLDKDRFYEEPQDTLKEIEKRIAELEILDHPETVTQTKTVIV